MPPDEVRLDLGEDTIEELMALAETAHKLQQILSDAKAAGPQIGTLSVARQLSKKVGVSVAELRPVLLALVNYYTTQTSLELTAEQMADLIAIDLKRSAKTDEDLERLKKWDGARQEIIRAVSQIDVDHPLLVSAKAIRVATSHQFDLVEMRILTDIRPVFNKVGTKVIQGIISHVLSIDYHVGSDHRVIQFNLDAQSLKKLCEQCERAVEKATILKQDLSMLPWKVSVFREPTENNSGES